MVDTEGSGILGIASSGDFDLISHFSAKYRPTRATVMSSQYAVYSPSTRDSLTALAASNIMMDSSVQPVIHEARKCPIQIKDDINNCLEDNYDNTGNHPKDRRTDRMRQQLGIREETEWPTAHMS